MSGASPKLPASLAKHRKTIFLQDGDTIQVIMRECPFPLVPRNIALTLVCHARMLLCLRNTSSGGGCVALGWVSGSSAP